MGNCLSKNEKINEHSNVQRRLRIGIGLKKGDDGNFHFGLEGGFEVKKDKDFSLVENKNGSENTHHRGGNSNDGGTIGEKNDE